MPLATLPPIVSEQDRRRRNACDELNAYDKDSEYCRI
jgi:hypothetical protein